MDAWIACAWIGLAISGAVTVRKPLYQDPNGGYAREMAPTTDAMAAPAVYLQNPNSTQDQNVYLARDANGMMTLKDPSVSAPVMLSTLSSGVLQVVCTKQSTSVTATTAYVTVLTQSITTAGNSRVIAMGAVTSSNSGTATYNMGTLNYGATSLAVGASAWDGGTVSTSNIPQTMTLLGTTPTLSAGSTAFTLQVKTATGTAQVRPGTTAEGSSLCLFEVSP